MFEIFIAETVPAVSGTVSGWDREALELRAMASAGGQYTHDASGLVTLEKIAEDSYRIVDLEMFYRRFGWCQILLNGNYAPPGDVWDEE